MNKRIFFLFILVVGSLSSTQVTAEKEVKVQPRKSAVRLLGQMALGAGCTAGFGYVLYNFADDVQRDKIYRQDFALTTDYFKNNKAQLTRDAFTGLGFLYLTYRSGLYTIAKLGELLQTVGESRNNA